MLVLISKDRKGNQHYTGFKNEAQLQEALRTKYDSFAYIENIFPSKKEVRDEMFSILQKNSLPTHPQLSPIEALDKEGNHILAYKRNTSLSIEVIKAFFVCDESELTEEEKEKVQENGENGTGSDTDIE
jgi:hypothetical protein